MLEISFLPRTFFCGSIEEAHHSFDEPRKPAKMTPAEAKATVDALIDEVILKPPARMCSRIKKTRIENRGLVINGMS